jgi:hypothetical protein
VVHSDFLELSEHPIVRFVDAFVEKTADLTRLKEEIAKLELEINAIRMCSHGANIPKTGK